MVRQLRTYLKRIKLEKAIKGFRDIEVPSQYLQGDSPVVQLLDAGHGGMIDDKYVTYPSKMYDHKDFVFYEGVVNRLIVKSIARHCLRKKLNYVIIGDTEKDLKLHKRTEIANNFMKNNPKFLPYYHSVHCNAFYKDLGVNGYQVHILNKDSSESFKIASRAISIQSDKDFMRTRKYPLVESNYTVLRKTNMPALLTENGFFTNKKEAEWLLTEEAQYKLGLMYAELQEGIIKEDIL